MPEELFPLLRSDLLCRTPEQKDFQGNKPIFSVVRTTNLSMLVRKVIYLFWVYLKWFLILDRDAPPFETWQRSV